VVTLQVPPPKAAPQRTEAAILDLKDQSPGWTPRNHALTGLGFNHHLNMSLLEMSYISYISNSWC
jgi:hypothetical protein